MSERDYDDRAADAYDQRMEDLREDAVLSDEEALEELADLNADYVRDCLPAPHRWKP